MPEYVERSELDRRLAGYATVDWLVRNYTLASSFRAGMDPLLRRVSAVEVSNASASDTLRGLGRAVARLGDIPGLVCSVETSAEQLEAVRAQIARLSAGVTDMQLRAAPAFPLVEIGDAGIAVLKSGTLQVGDACVTSVPAGPLVEWRAANPGCVFRFSVPPPETLGSGVRVARDFVVTFVYPTSVEGGSPPRLALELELAFEPSAGDSVSFRTRGGDLFTFAGADLGQVVALRFTEVAPSVLAVTRTVLEDYP